MLLLENHRQMQEITTNCFYYPRIGNHADSENGGKISAGWPESIVSNELEGGWRYYMPLHRNL